MDLRLHALGAEETSLLRDVAISLVNGKHITRTALCRKIGCNRDKLAFFIKNKSVLRRDEYRDFLAPLYNEIMLSSQYENISDSDIKQKINDLRQIANKSERYLYTYDGMLRKLFGYEGKYVNEMPKDVLGEYYGYRFSTEQKSLVKFYTKIYQEKFYSSCNYTMYINLYKDGVGGIRETNECAYWFSDILYLVGHVKDRKAIKTFALRRRAADRILNGIVMSISSKIWPIAAGTLLIPIDEHKNPTKGSEDAKENIGIGPIEEYVDDMKNIDASILEEMISNVPQKDTVLVL